MLVESIAAMTLVPAFAFFLGRWQGDVRFTTLMTIYGIVLGLVTIFSLQDTIVHGAWNVPDLAGSDGEGYFVQAERLTQDGILNFQDSIRANYLGYQIFLAILFSIFGANVAVGVIANDIILLFTIICIYRATLQLTEAPRAAMLACAAFMLTTANIFYGLVLLKEPALCLAFALILLALVNTIIRERLGFWTVVQVLGALALIVTMRATVLLFLFVLFAFFAKILVRRRAHVLVAALALIAIAAPVAQNFTIYEISPERLASEITQNSVIDQRLQQGDIGVAGIAGRVIASYIALPFVAKAALFPIPTIVQVLLPFDVWSTEFIDEHFALLLFRNFNVAWLMFVAPWFIFSVVNVRRIDRPLIGRLLLAGLAYYIVVAIIYGGLIPRYGVPALIFVYPAIGYWWARRQTSPMVRSGSEAFFIHYYAFFIIAALGYLGLQIAR